MLLKTLRAHLTLMLLPMVVVATPVWAELALPSGTDLLISNLPDTHWANTATRMAVANNIMMLENGSFNGDRILTETELKIAMTSLSTTLETLGHKGVNKSITAMVNGLSDTSSPVSRMRLAQSLSRFLMMAEKENMVAVGMTRSESYKYTDIGSRIPESVKTVVDRYKVMTGYPDKTFRPSRPVNRYEMAAITSEMLKMLREAPVASVPRDISDDMAIVTPKIDVPAIVTPPRDSLDRTLSNIDKSLTSRRVSFRQNAPVFLSWQAANINNIQNSAQPFNVVPVQGMFTLYRGPFMLQNVTNFRYNFLQDNLLDSELRLGLSELKAGAFQFIPYVGANAAAGASIRSNLTQYDTYAGLTYGGIVSVMPVKNLDLFANFGQSALLSAGRFGQDFFLFQNVNPANLALSNYGVGLDYYIAPTMALTLGVNTWQQPQNLRLGNAFNAGVTNTVGGNLGLGFAF
jgi:hypothetical protein